MKKRTFAALTAAVLLSGCGTFVVPAYSPDYPTLDRLKGRALEPVALATVEPTDAKSAINVITLRGAAFEPPGGSFAAYLESALRADLGELRLLNPAAPTRLSATLLKNDFDVSGFSTGTGTLVVRIAIARAILKDAPVLRFNYMSDPEDWVKFRHAVRVTREIFNQKAFDPYREAEVAPGPNVQSDEEIDAYLADLRGEDRAVLGATTSANFYHLFNKAAP